MSGIQLNLDKDIVFVPASQLFESKEKIGKGTYGSIFKVKLKNNDSEYAIKYLPLYSYRQSRKLRRYISDSKSGSSSNSRSNSSSNSRSSFRTPTEKSSGEEIKNVISPNKSAIIAGSSRATTVNKSESVGSSFSSASYNSGDSYIDSNDVSEYDIFYSYLRHTVIINEACVPSIIPSDNIIKYQSVFYIQDLENSNLFNPPTELFVGLLMPLYKQDLRNFIKQRIRNNNYPRFDLSFKKNREMIFSLVESVALCTYYNILHGDIKPANFLVSADHKPVLADFGLAQTGFCTHRPDQLGMVFTLWERPPEILFGFKYGFRSDVWALGCSLYELYKGYPILSGNNQVDILRKIIGVWGNFSKYWPEFETAPNYRLAKSAKDGFQFYKMKPELIQPSLWAKEDYEDFQDDGRYDFEFKNMLDRMLHINPAGRASIFDIYHNTFFHEFEKKISHTTCYQQSIINYKPQSNPSILPSFLDKVRINGMIAVEQLNTPSDVYFQFSNLCGRIFSVTKCEEVDEVNLIIASCMVLAHYLRYETDYLPILDEGFMTLTSYGNLYDKAGSMSKSHVNTQHMDKLNKMVLTILRDSNCNINNSTIYDFWQEFIETQSQFSEVMKKFMKVILIIHSLFNQETDESPLRIINLIIWLIRAVYQSDKYEIIDEDIDVNFRRSEWRDKLLNMLDILDRQNMAVIDFHDVWYQKGDDKVYIREYRELYDFIKWNTPKSYILP